MHTWVIGLDLRERSQGALHFARWVAARHRAAPADLLHLLAVHVVDAGTMRRSLRGEDFDEMMDERRRKAVAVVEEILGDKADVLVVAGDRPDERLAAAATLHGAEGLVIGRQAKANEERLVALGRVARRLVRTLPAPTWCVPPDWTEDRAGDGPILVAIDGREDCLPALRYAARMGVELGRKVLAVFVVELPEPWGEPYANLPRLLAEARDRFIEEARPEVESFLGGAGYGDMPYEVREGPVVQRLLEAADEHASPCIVTGSRKLSLVERFFTSSVGSTLAAAADRPVALVPPA
ncbi:MAG: universal stress protein [Deltaproteobacteria bacterium]|nr:MAG: universal stress protein [Deltaproteobacteria bacterium]